MAEMAEMAEMASNFTDLGSFKELDERVKNIGGNIDQLFLLVMGCLIFCEY